ncbi:hypothetical protein GCM10027442_41000 [Emticicia fontis]
MITGQVLASYKKEPWPGVIIIEKGTDNATQSKQDGTFSINVSDANATLVFSFVGLVTQEYRLKGATRILVKMEDDCIRDFFDIYRVCFYANSGVLNNPVGGQLYITFRPIYGAGVLNSSFGLQSDLRGNQFLNAQTEFMHFALHCDFDMNARWHYREVSYYNNFRSKVYSFETDFNFGRKIWFLKNLNATVGYGHLDLKTDKQSATGPVIGLGTYITIRRFSYGLITGKVAIFRNNIEWQGQITQSRRNFNVFIKYYQLKSFSELSIGVGKEFGYRFKKPFLRK